MLETLSEVTLRAEWTPMPGPRPYRVRRTDTGEAVGKYPSFEEAQRALPKIAAKILRGKVERVTD